MTNDAYKLLVHSPVDLSGMHISHYERIKNSSGITFGIEAIDKKVIPQHPGDVTYFCGRPGHGKSSLLAFMARRESKEIQKRQAKKECIVYVTWEQTAEELEAFFQINEQYTATDYAWGRVPVDVVKTQAYKRVDVPIWVIGHSIKNAGIQLPRMTVDIVFHCLESMKQDFGITPVLMCMDYIQLVPIPRQARRTEQINEAVIQVKELAMRMACPAIVGVQASRSVDERNLKIPEMRDAQWASAIEQSADKFFGLWRPFQTENENDTVSFDDFDYAVTPELFILRMVKQRFESGRATWPLYFDPAYLKLCDWEKQQAPLNPDPEFR